MINQVLNCETSVLCLFVRANSTCMWTTYTYLASTFSFLLEIYHSDFLWTFILLDKGKPTSWQTLYLKNCCYLLRTSSEDAMRSCPNDYFDRDFLVNQLVLPHTVCRIFFISETLSLSLSCARVHRIKDDGEWCREATHMFMKAILQFQRLEVKDQRHTSQPTSTILEGLQVLSRKFALNFFPLSASPPPIECGSRTT